jgi:hypothetical protein
MVYFHTKNLIWVFFGRPWDGKFWRIPWPFGIVIPILVYFMEIRYFHCHFGTFFPILVCCTKKNLATLLRVFWVFDRFFT